MGDFMGMESSNGQMARNIVEITIMGNVKEMDNSSTLKTRASLKAFGAKEYWKGKANTKTTVGR